jgi:alcohol dehydrogenase (cytochrome c)
MLALVGTAAVGLPAQQGITTKDLLDGFATPTRWLTYSGDYSGRRHSPLTQITPANVAQLTPQWTFQTGVPTRQFETSTLVIDGTLYVTGAQNNAWAVDARTGKALWHYQRPIPQGLRACCGLVNRGFAVLGNRLYLATLDAHLVALDRTTGAVVWDVEIADFRNGYASTAAPLIVGNKIITGIAGGEFAIRGFLDAYDVDTGKRVWRFWTVPAPGEKGSDTWPADAWERGGGGTWLTGSYDPELNLVYWGAGNPNPDFYGDSRKGDNLYTGSLLALNPDTGELKWHFQFTPHDVHDWDANHIPVLADLTLDGKPQKVVMVANRNGFFYLLDRATGRFLRATPYVKQTWAKAIGPDGRPIEEPNQRPTPEGTFTCPDLYGGTNFMSPSYDPKANLFFVTARETCMWYFSAEPPKGYKAGDLTMGGKFKVGERTGALRAIDPVSGERKWEITYPTPSWAGVLSTASGLVFTGTNEGDFLAVDAKSGKELYRHAMGAPFYAAPVTYMLDGRQYVTVPAGDKLIAFATSTTTR